MGWGGVRPSPVWWAWTWGQAPPSGMAAERPAKHGEQKGRLLPACGVPMAKGPPEGGLESGAQSCGQGGARAGDQIRLRQSGSQEMSLQPGW